MLGKSATPNLNLSQVSEMMEKLFKLTPTKLHTLPSYDDQNFYVATSEGKEYVLKILNSEDSQNPTMFEVQTYAMSFLHQKGLPAQTALPNISGELMSLEEIDCGQGCQKFLVRLLTYLPGTTVSKDHLTAKLLYDAGKMAATMDMMLKEMEHPDLPVLERKGFRWSLSCVPMMESYLHILDGDPLQDIVRSVIQQYKTLVAPKYSEFSKGVIHGDFNNLNMLVRSDEGGEFKVIGILDFGDMHSDVHVHELAIMIMYLMTEHPDPIEVGGPVLAGWESLFPLNESERECLFTLVLCRFCQSLLYARYFVILNPENEEYLMISSKRGLGILKQLMELGKEKVEKVWFESAAEFRDGEE